MSLTLNCSHGMHHTRLFQTLYDLCFQKFIFFLKYFYNFVVPDRLTAGEHDALHLFIPLICCNVYLFINSNSIRVKSGTFGQTAKFGQRPCLFHISNIGIKNKLTKQTVKILMRRLIRSRLIWIYTVCKCVPQFT